MDITKAELNYTIIRVHCCILLLLMIAVPQFGQFVLCDYIQVHVCSVEKQPALGSYILLFQCRGVDHLCYVFSA